MSSRLLVLSPRLENMTQEERIADMASDVPAYANVQVRDSSS